MQYRPAFHFSPKRNWINDPNGCLKLDGTYHLFYQYNPKDIVWGPMHWGHAVSGDLLSWEEKEIALSPGEWGQAFSGTAVMDRNNDSGLFEDNRGMVLFFTGHQDGDEPLQRQCMAFSRDRGETFEYYQDNPVVDNPGLKDYRDPKVFYHGESKKWIMILAAGDHMEILNSENLRDWTRVGSFAQPVPGRETLWECPDLFPLLLEETGEIFWVLIISHGSEDALPVQLYVIGRFDGKSFAPLDREWHILDGGVDYYAAQSWFDDQTLGAVNKTSRQWIGWASHWHYADRTPDGPEGFRGIMALPRRGRLETPRGKIRLIQEPAALPREKKVIASGTMKKEVFLHGTLSFYGELAFTSLDGGDQTLELVFGDEKVTITVKAGSLVFDRRDKAGFFDDKWGLFQLPRLYESTDLKMALILDASVLEIFLDDGLQAFCYRIFPGKNLDSLRFSRPGKCKGRVVLH